MTRDEEIKQASVDYQLSTDPRAIGGDAFADMAREMNVNPSFIAGAKWADSHQRKGLVDIDKAIRWLKDKADSFAYISAHSGEAKVSYQIVEEFEKAMME